MEATLARIQPLVAPVDHALIVQLVESFMLLTRLARERGTSIARLRRFVGHSSSEKSAKVLAPHPPRTEVGRDATAAPATDDPPSAKTGDQAPANAPGSAQGPNGGSAAPTSSSGTNSPPPPPPEKKKRKGHGRIPASAYGAAPHIYVPHEDLHPGDNCPACIHGTLYDLKDPAPFLRIVGQAPLAAACWDAQQLRCSPCGKVYTARVPEEARGPKYSESAASMLAVMRYDAGMPLNRMENLQRDLDTPVPASTQWDILDQRAELLRPAYAEMVRQAAQGKVVHNDDTYARILAYMGKQRAALLAAGELPDPERTGLFTTGIVSIIAAGAIALFYSGRKHAGENLDDVLALRDADLPPPIQMGDALSRNVPKNHPVDASNCLTHARRGLVDEVENYPDECRHALELLGRVYAVDEFCKKEGMSDEARLATHQGRSGPAMEELKNWITAQFEEKRVEPNSGLGEAYNYMLKRWDKLTRFLKVPGVPLDNNICERILKAAIRHRRNSLFFRSPHGAQVGDMYMALIHTTRLHGGNPFDYLTALQVHARAVAEKPAEWMPWNYRTAVARRLADRAHGPSPPAPDRRVPPTPAPRPTVAASAPAGTA